MLKYMIGDLCRNLECIPLVLAVGLFFFLLFAGINGCRKMQKKKPLRGSALSIFFMYLYLLLYITILSRESGHPQEADWQLFSTLHINARNSAYLYENILLFVPFGWIAAWNFPKLRDLVINGAYGGLLSLIIECTQKITNRGLFQVDDLMTNFVGSIVGCLIFLICRGICRQARKRRK